MNIKKGLGVVAAVAALLTIAVAPQAGAATKTTPDGFGPVKSVPGLKLVPMKPAAGKRAAGAAADDVFQVQNEWSGRCLDAKSAEFDKNGATIQLWDCDGNYTEGFSITANAEGYLRFQNATNGRYLEASKHTGAGANGTKIQLWDFVAGGSNQWWLPVQNAEGHWRLRNVWSGRYLDASLHTPGKGVNGTKVQLWDFQAGASNQWW